MVRNYKRKSNRVFYDNETICKALQEIRNSKCSLRKIAKKYNMNPSGLAYYMKKLKNSDNANYEIILRREVSRKVLPDDIENKLKSNILMTADMYIEISPQDVRRLAYDFGIRNGLKMPDSWKDEQKAGIEWFYSFMKRNPSAFVRDPEAINLARASNFNKENVKSFFDKYEMLISKYKFEAKDILNMDETIVTTELKSNKTDYDRERVEYVTLATTISAVGAAIPPFFIISKGFLTEDTLNLAPKGSGVSSRCSRWMTKEIFIEYLQHLVKSINCTIDKPCLLLFDNHVSHVSFEAIQFAKSNGIVMLTFPPHCSHKLQPLERSIIDSLKLAVNSALIKWRSFHRGKVRKLKPIPALVSLVYPEVLTTSNIQSGFRVSGIYPFNPNIFTEEDFSPSPTAISLSEIDNIEINQDLNPSQSSPNEDAIKNIPNYKSPADIQQDHIHTFCIKKDCTDISCAKKVKTIRKKRKKNSKILRSKENKKLLVENNPETKINIIVDKADEVIAKKMNLEKLSKHKENVNKNPTIRKIYLKKGLVVERIKIKIKKMVPNLKIESNIQEESSDLKIEPKRRRQVKPNVRLSNYVCNF